MRGQKGSDAKVSDVPPQLEVENGDQVPRVWIMPVDTVSIDRRIRPRVIGRYCELMHPRRKSVQDLNRVEGYGIKEKHLRTHPKCDSRDAVAANPSVTNHRATQHGSPVNFLTECIF
jgi:hypothetical protein